MAHTADGTASIWQFKRIAAEYALANNDPAEPTRVIHDYLQGGRLDGNYLGASLPVPEDLPLCVPKQDRLCSPCHFFLDTFMRRDFGNSDIWTSIRARTVCYTPWSVNHDAFERSVRFLDCRLCSFFVQVSADKLNKTRTPGPLIWGTWTLQPMMIGHEFIQPFVFYFGSTTYRSLSLGCGPPNMAVYLAPSHHDRDSGYACSPGLKFRKSGSAGAVELAALRTAPPLAVRSAGVTKMIKQWQEECLSTHTSCRRLSLSAQQRPSRLLAVCRGNNAIPSVRLTQEVAHKTYLALSYAWGKTLPLTTTKENIDTFLVNIPIESMPKTLREAATLTLDLGYEFIWIDALCIVQDDPDDWAMEGAKMHWIYQGATLTLSAAAADNCAAGLFPDKSSTVRSEPIDLELRAQGPGETEVEAEEAKDDRIVVIPKPPPSSPQQLSLVVQYEGHERLPPHIRARGYLSTRGWVLQERILAPALVHFAATDMIWECRQYCVSETGDRSDAIDRFFKGVRTIKEVSMEQEDSEESWHRRWLNAVVNYTERELTYPEDKLPAVGGLARYIRGEGLESRYLAGHWLDKWFVESLIWYRDKRDVMPAPTGKYIAPSWSWARIIGRVKWTYALTDLNTTSKKTLKPCCTLTGWAPSKDQAHQWPSTDGSVYGQLPCPVYIELSGLLFPRLPYSHVDMAAAEATAKLVDSGKSNSFGWTTGDEEDLGQPAWCISWDTADGIPEEWYLLHVALEGMTSGEGGVDMTWHFLMLKRKTTGIAEEGGSENRDDIQDFERVGKAICTVHKMPMEQSQDYVPRLLKNCPSFAKRLLRIW